LLFDLSGNSLEETLNTTDQVVQERRQEITEGNLSSFDSFLTPELIEQEGLNAQLLKVFEANDLPGSSFTVDDIQFYERGNEFAELNERSQLLTINLLRQAESLGLNPNDLAVELANIFNAQDASINAAFDSVERERTLRRRGLSQGVNRELVQNVIAPAQFAALSASLGGNPAVGASFGQGLGTDVGNSGDTLAGLQRGAEQAAVASAVVNAIENPAQAVVNAILGGGEVGGAVTGTGSGLLSNAPSNNLTTPELELNPYEINPIVLNSAFNMLGNI
jgi:hypothetical protein